MGIFPGTKDEYLASLNQGMTGRGLPSPANKMGPQAGPSGYNLNDIYFGSGGGSGSPIAMAQGATYPAPGSLYAPGGPVFGGGGLPSSIPQITVSGANPISAYAPSPTASPAVGAISGMVPDLPMSKAGGQNPIGQTYVVGGRTYVRSPDGTITDMGRADPGASGTMMDGAIRRGVEGAGLSYAGQLGGVDSAMAQGAAPPVTVPQVNRTGMLPNGSTYVDGVRTGVDPAFAHLTPSQRDQWTTDNEGIGAAMQANNPQAALASFLRDQANWGSSGENDSTQAKRQMQQAAGWDNLTPDQRRALQDPAAQGANAFAAAIAKQRAVPQTGGPMQQMRFPTTIPRR